MDLMEAGGWLRKGEGGCGRQGAGGDMDLSETGGYGRSWDGLRQKAGGREKQGAGRGRRLGGAGAGVGAGGGGQEAGAWGRLGCGISHRITITG